MYETARTEREIEDARNAATEQVENGTRWPGMSYEQGVEDALAWVVGDTDESPMADE